MADREKTITHLKAYVNCYADRHKTCNQNCVLYGHGDCAKYVIESINDALELLKEQEPIKPIKPIRHENWWEEAEKHGWKF